MSIRAPIRGEQTPPVEGRVPREIGCMRLISCDVCFEETCRCDSEEGDHSWPANDNDGRAVEAGSVWLPDGYGVVSVQLSWREGRECYDMYYNGKLVLTNHSLEDARQDLDRYVDDRKDEIRRNSR